MSIPDYLLARARKQHRSRRMVKVVVQMPQEDSREFDRVVARVARVNKLSRWRARSFVAAVYLVECIDPDVLPRYGF